MKNEQYIVWNDANLLGVSILDEQHRGIVSAINSFYYFVHNDKGKQVLASTLNILEQYTYIHFITEEALIKAAGYKDFDKHVEMHARLFKQTKKIVRELSSDYDVSMEALAFLKEWWLLHINQEDRKYAPAMHGYLPRV